MQLKHVINEDSFSTPLILKLKKCRKLKFAENSEHYPALGSSEEGLKNQTTALVYRGQI